MTQSSYLTHLRSHKLEPQRAARLRGKMRKEKRKAANGTAEQRQAAKYAVYELTSKWWRMVKE